MHRIKGRSTSKLQPQPESQPESATGTPTPTEENAEPPDAVAGPSTLRRMPTPTPVSTFSAGSSQASKRVRRWASPESREDPDMGTVNQLLQRTDRTLQLEEKLESALQTPEQPPNQYWYCKGRNFSGGFS